ncbi:MAG: FRG domain-containing protein [Candidatus Margulisbacteria bacterium]|nr:FRG domain-containing protein [Candidatus Margulisiibacteriota bacterium]
MKIGSTKTFIDALNNITTSDDYELFFRGHSQEKKYSLIPAIYRPKYINFLRNEDRIFREILSYLPEDFRNEKTTFDCLVKMQHYSIPTRLLDLTKNPLVALYFAARKDIKLRGEVVVLKIPKKEIRHFESDSVSIVSNLSKRPFNFDISGYKINRINIFNKKKEISYLLHEIKSEKPYFLSIIEPKTIGSVLCVNPKMNNQRILRQEGAFLLFGINQTKEMPATIQKDWILFNSEKKKFLIYQKEKILNELNRVGINERFLFPELDKQAEFLKAKYA